MRQLLPGESITQRNHGKQALDPEAELDALADLSIDIDDILHKQAVCQPPNTGIRRLLEMRREEQLLQQQLGDSYDP